MMRIISIIILVLWIGLVLSCSTEKELGIIPIFLASTLLIPFLYNSILNKLSNKKCESKEQMEMSK